jgi:Flp pilus assembly protein TadD
MLEISRFLPDRANVWTDLAAMHARVGGRSEALAALARAVELNPSSRAQIVENPAFESLRSDAQFRRIVGG